MVLATMRPGQIRLKGDAEVIQGPGDDHVVSEHGLDRGEEGVDPDSFS